MTKEELYGIIALDESFRIERTTSTSNMDKFQEAICAFANDLPGCRKKGYLLIGVTDKGEISGLKVDDALMKRISAIRSDGNILPLPIMNTEKVHTEQGDVLVVEVTPSFDTPVRYRGRTFVRIGPRRDIATAEEERILSERCAASLPTFDTYPCREASIDDIYADIIVKEYLPKAIDADVLANDQRPLKEQLASLHLYNMQWDCPTYAALIMFGKNPKYFMHGAYIQFVRFKGNDNGGEILNERRFEGSLYKVLPLLENFIRDGIITKRPVPVSILREKDVLNYPYKALRELMMNALMHRDYQSNMPTRIYQYDNHIEIMNPGGLYGQARPENFPHVNDYRNSVVAEMMKTLNYVNMFNHGISEVQELLKENNSPEAEFNVNYVTAFSVVIRDEDVAYNTSTVHQLFTNLSTQDKSLIINLKEQQLSTSELQLFTNCSPQSKQLFIKQVITPNIENGIIAMTHPETPHHPRQKYYLTELGLKILEMLQNNKQ
ncbi:MAG: putative DNA binding domain-containing protein [Bacteroidales bacterium]|nr:putative DNA binding domain-containing protein [Bacteroidales bacterium]MBR3946978.1 putative DNA binding domain-containing protein [Bacteroidales bacterium]